MDPITAPIDGAELQVVGGVRMDVAPVGNGRVKRLVYPAGFHWVEDMKPLVGTDLCMHAHLGFLAKGAIAGRYRDGCEFAYAAPAFVAIEPGHDAWVVGDDEAVLIQFDAAENTAERFGLPDEHGH
jgi:hypothetical protein